MAVPPGYVGIECANPPLRLMCALGEQPPALSEGLGGWETTDRPQQTAMTTWKGNAPFSLSLNVMLDGWAQSTSVEADIDALYDVARGRESQPGCVQLRGIPHLPADDWVIAGIEAGDAVIRRASDNLRVRQDLTLSLLEFCPPDWESVKKTALQGARARTHLVTVKHSPSKGDPRSRGETPAQMARRLKIKWTDIRALNPKTVRGANTPLVAGAKVRVPLPSPTASKSRSTGKGRR
jgi:hypothetical protein